MELNQLRYFCEVARTEHVTNSAKALHVAQPALTRSIHRLEEELGIPLFAASGRRIKLTPAGAHLLQKAQPLLAGIDGLKADLEAFAQDHNRTVVIDVRGRDDLTIGSVVDYKRFYPDAEFRLVRYDTEGIADIVRDCRPIEGSEVPDIALFDRAIEFTEDIMLAVPHDHPFGDCIDPHELEGQRIISLSHNFSFRQICDEICARQGVHVDIDFESDSLSMTNRLVQLGMGIAFWPIYSWKEIGHKHARLVRLNSPSFAQVVRTELRNPETATPEARRFFRFECGNTGHFHSRKHRMPNFGPDDIPEIAAYAGRDWTERELTALDNPTWSWDDLEAPVP